MSGMLFKVNGVQISLTDGKGVLNYPGGEEYKFSYDKLTGEIFSNKIPDAILSKIKQRVLSFKRGERNARSRRVERLQISRS